MRSLRIHHILPVLLLAATGPVFAGAAAAAEPDFQYVGQDDRPHGLTAPKGCVGAEGGGGRAVSNRTPATAAFYREPGCKGRAVEVLRPGAVTQVRPYFASVAFGVTG
ncbi:hypothetical protein ACIGFK_17975 [Streptomyces sp. NPDC085524]|uniref:hypothetical protein n=1 Tax=unclassified Streptomyces TaxID=2593676 RepID=UPI0035DCA317